MEGLLQNLQEQQIHLQQQHISIHDLANMENYNDGKPRLPPQLKYVSIFHIDGEPILPPLMTTEKRRQMKILKEKALKIEQSLRQRKQQQPHHENDEDLKSDKSSTLLSNTSGNISQRSQDYYESELKETEESMALLKKIIQREPGGIDEKLDMKTPRNISTHFHTDNNLEKLQKLQKSEILIYDNSKNEVIQVPAKKEKKAAEGQWRQLREIDCQTKFNYVPNEKPNNLLLVGANSKGCTAIPLICLNPPTPLTANKSLCESLSGTESSESFITSENLSKPLNLGQDSSDESFNSMITQSDQKPNTSIYKNMIKTTKKPEIYKSVEKNAKNVCEKIQQYEAISSETNSPLTSPEKLYKNRKACLGTPTGTMSRSATSPSIKLSSSNRSSSSRSQSLVQDSPDNSLVRSSSFTLEGPSDALIEHMQQQQKVIRDTKTAFKSPLNTTRNICRKPISSPLRAHRDTVESKAKKVQKVELKSSRQRIQQKASQTRLAQVAAASISPCNTNSLCKIKKSPYDISKTSHASLQSLQKNSSTQMRKSNSTLSNLTQTKTSKSRLISCTSTSARTAQTDKELYNQMAKVQKDKFLKLLVHQEEEHQRLQQSFEMQQKLLLEQLNREMTASHLKSPNNSNFPSSLSFTCQQKRIEGQHVFSPQKQSQLNSTGFLLNHASKKQHKAQPNQNQSCPSSISNNSSYASVDRPEMFNSPHSLHATHYTKSLQSITPNKSNFSLLDHSNANISLDISTLSIQTTSDVVYDTPAIQNNGVNNNAGNKTTPSSRRRLFTTEMKSVGIDASDPSTRCVETPQYVMGQRFGEYAKQSQKLNHNKISLPSTNDSKRRLSADNSLLLHTAATKINAYARGFLVRRLFQTEQIQRLVQTIRDTLLFVLNLHIETIENPEESYTPANIKLKARLLQQLSSACRTLHLVLFQTTIKERMEIIARDRKRIKSKLMSVNAKRTKWKMKSNSV